MSKRAVEHADKVSLEDLQRDLTARGWAVRMGRSKEVSMVAIKRNFVFPNALMDSPSGSRNKTDIRSMRRSRLAKPLENKYPPGKGLYDLHGDLTRRRWSMMVGSYCNYNPSMPKAKAKLLRALIPDYLEHLKGEGWSVKIKEDKGKTTIVVSKHKPSLIRRLRSRLIGR